MMYRLLLAEDEPLLRKLYEIELTEDGYEVDTVSNGRDAVRMAIENNYDLIIMDIQMPEMDGIKAITRIVAKNKKTPIIIHTEFPQYRNNFLTWIANAYITKSSNIDDLKREIRSLLLQQQDSRLLQEVR